MAAGQAAKDAQARENPNAPEVIQLSVAWSQPVNQSLVFMGPKWVELRFRMLGLPLMAPRIFLVHAPELVWSSNVVVNVPLNLDL